MHREENTAKRESQSMALLEKLIRLDSKDCNFHFKDALRSVYFKVSYPQTNTDNNSNEALLRQLWHHIHSHYFKRIDSEEWRRLNYAASIFSTFNNYSYCGRATVCSSLGIGTQFQDQMRELFSQQYMAGLQRTSKYDGQSQLWIKSLWLQCKSQQMKELMNKNVLKKSKLIYSKLKQNRKQRQLLKRKKAIAEALQQDVEDIDQLIAEILSVEDTHSSEIDMEIAKIERELAQISQEAGQVIESIKEKVEEEIDQGQNRQNNRQFSASDTSKDLECLQYLIKCLQEKQVAESVAKIISTERSNGQIMFQTSYEKAMNIQPKLVNQKQLNRINFLRETSLLHFYRTGVKSLYSYVCHNYVGFRELKQNRLNITAKMKDKCMMQMMKKGACLASLGEIQHEMGKFNTCHHCKFLYPQYLLFTCKFSSDKQAIPKINIQASCDPNLAEAFQQGPYKNRTSQRFMTRKKNCLTSYAKIHDEYVCGRKYCMSCLKDTYSHENIKQNGFCPFCLGTCICTRCLRNEKIAKFKNMYSLLGGDLNKMQQSSDLEQLQIKVDEQVQRGRGRPKKYAISHISINTTQKKLRRFEDKQNYVSKALLLSKKSKRKASAYSYWKRNDSGNDTQEEMQTKRKKKRGVGRPRLDKVTVHPNSEEIPASGMI